jgi:hypothetical protein
LRLTFLVLFLGAVFGVAGALVYHVWLGAFASAILAIAFAPRALDAVTGGRRRRSWREVIPVKVKLSRPQQILLGGVLVYIPLLVWRIVDGGWMAAAITGPFFLIYVAWFVYALRRDGWSPRDGSETGRN